MESELVTYKDFNPNAVGGFVKDFKDTLEFAGLSDLAVLGLDLKGQEEANMPTEEMVARVSAGPVHLPAGAVGIPPKQQIATPKQALSIGEISTPVGRDGDTVVFASVKFSADLRKEFVTSLKKYLDYLETTLN